MNEDQKKIDEKGSNLIDSIRDFFNELLNIKSDCHEENTIERIRENISMKGSNAWILVFSIFIASIGLNANSTAVVIGAMLISPLMGPILGIGLSIGINDVDMMRRSLVNLAVMVALSLITSFLYFSIPLFQDETTEILARVRPDVRDVLIALSGGLALIIALSRPSPSTNTVAGVAIATALMPPLCVAGYGLALGNLKYFLGAMFLFTINSIFIAIATFAIVRYMHFSMVKYIDQVRRRRISRMASAIAIIVVAGSLYSFYNLVKQKQYTQAATQFIEELKEDGVSILGDEDKSIDYEKKKITLQLLDMPNGELKSAWQKRLEEKGIVADLILKGQDDSEIKQQVQNLQDLYAQNQKIITGRDESIKEKDDKIRQLETELNKFYKFQVDFKSISEEAKIIYPELDELSYFKEFKTNFEALDTVSVVRTKWNTSLKKEDIDKAETKLNNWLIKRMEVDKLKIERE